MRALKWGTNHVSASTVATSAGNPVELDKWLAALTPFAEPGFHLDLSVI